jgi:hypothetical protein
MTNRILATVLFAACLLMLPMVSQASLSERFAIEQIDDKSDVQISVSRQSVHITNAEGQVMEVISLTGRHVLSVRIESPAQRIELTNIPKGCYIIKVGKVVRKIVI